MEKLGPLTLIISEEQTVNLDYEDELKLSEEEINNELRDQPSLYAYYAVLGEMAEAALAEAKLQLDTTTASLDGKYREQLASMGKVTENLVANSVKVDEDYIAAVLRVNVARKNVGLLGAIKEAFRHRKDMLVTLASNMRIQADSTLYIRKPNSENEPEMGPGRNTSKA